MEARTTQTKIGMAHFGKPPVETQNGEIYSFTVIRQVAGRGSSKAFEPDIPYVIAWVDLEEGPRMITNVVNCPVEE